MRGLFQSRAGQGSPLVILHGLLGSSDNFRSFQKRLQQDFDVVLVDLRNHGRSFHAEGMSYDEMAEDVENLCREEGIDCPWLLGHSMGGKVAMKIALRGELDMEGLIVADMAPKAYDGPHRELLKVLSQLDLDFLTDRAAVDAALAKDVSDVATRQLILKNLQVKDEGGLAWKPNVNALYRGYDDLNGWDGEGRYDGPSCFIYGGRSTYLMEEDRPGIREQFPKAEFVSIPEAGHWLHAERPNDFVRAVVSFMTGREG